MKRTKKARRALITSLISLVLCCVLLLGTTFAWFTDSVTNTGNTIQAGNLKVGLAYRDLSKIGDADYTKISDDATTAGALFTDILWEPGKANGVDLKVNNEGNLALDWALYFNNVTKTGEEDITKVLDVYVIGADDDQTALTDNNKIGTLAQLASGAGYLDGGTLATGETAFAVVLKMQETAGNTYQKCNVAFNLELRATQAAVEADGFDNTRYDELADGTPNNDWSFTVGGSASAEKPASGESATLSVDGATFTIPAYAVADNADEIVVNITPTGKPEGITVQADQTAAAYDIEVIGLKEDNGTPITVSLYVGKDLANVRVYHNSDEIAGAKYDPATGYVTFTTTSFSPFTVVYDGECIARVGDAYYASLTPAIMAANNGGTVYLLKDLDEAVTFDWNEQWQNVGPSSSEPNTYGNNCYTYTITNVTVCPQEGKTVTLKGLNFEPGKITETDPNAPGNSSYYKKLVIDGLHFENISFTDKVTLGSGTKGVSLINDVTFDGCSFDMTSSEEKYKDAIDLGAASGLAENDRYCTTETVIQNCTFINCRRSISMDKAKNTTIRDCTFTDCDWGIYLSNTVGSLTFVDNRLENGKGAIQINNVANNYAAYDYSSSITITGNVMIGMTESYPCQTTYDNGRTAGKSDYTISDNYWGAAEGATVVKGFRIKSTYGPSKAETILDTSPRDSAA